MCGIAGIVGPGGAAEVSLAKAMTDILAHRGPDDSGLWADHDVVLGHRRLSILDLSAAGHQPMTTPDERYFITFNGEIYNYLELRHELTRAGHSFRSGTDTEVLLAAYVHWGEACLSRFNGMWTFAIWDRQERRLFASRDRLGKKPFYYIQHRDRLYFASEIKALLLVPGLTRTPNAAAIADFCAERVSDHTEQTFIEGVSQLPPAGMLRWRDGVTRIDRYWSVPEPDPDEQLDLEEIRWLLDDSVRLRLRADTPVGCLVSGGLDSSAIACLMREHHTAETPVHVFTTLTEPANEEAKGVEHVLRKGGFEPHFHTPSARSFWEDLPRLLWHQEEPFADGSMAAHYALMREARSAGVPVVLTGQGADEVFAGYPTYLWVHLGSKLRRGQFDQVLQGMRRTHSHLDRRYDQIMAHLAFHALPRRIRAATRRRNARRRLRWLSPDLLSNLRVREDYGYTGTDDLYSYLRNSVQHWTLPGFLHYEDRNSMAFGVETRLPFLDYRLVEKMFRASSEAKLQDGETKKVLRDAVRHAVPREIVERQAKQGYPAPLAAWLRSLGTEIRDIAHSSVITDFPALNVPVWRQVTEGFLRHENEELDAVWRGLVCALWYQQISNVSGAPLAANPASTQPPRISSPQLSKEVA
jgi:asparagine synthase (glutamine-hydrolysing)